MTVQDIVIAFGGGCAAVAAFFLRECYNMLKKNTADIAEIKQKQIEHQVRLERLEEKLKIFHG